MLSNRFMNCYRLFPWTHKPLLCIKFDRYFPRCLETNEECIRRPRNGVGPSLLLLLRRYIYGNKNAKRTKCDCYQGIHIPPMINNLYSIRSFDINLLIQIQRHPVNVLSGRTNNVFIVCETIWPTGARRSFALPSSEHYDGRFMCVCVFSFRAHKQKYGLVSRIIDRCHRTRAHTVQSQCANKTNENAMGRRQTPLFISFCGSLST